MHKILYPIIFVVAYRWIIGGVCVCVCVCEGVCACVCVCVRGEGVDVNPERQVCGNSLSEREREIVRVLEY